MKKQGRVSSVIKSVLASDIIVRTAEPRRPLVQLDGRTARLFFVQEREHHRIRKTSGADDVDSFEKDIHGTV